MLTISGETITLRVPNGEVVETMSSSWIITRDGEPTPGVYATEAEAFGALLRRQPMSTDWAMKHEGWGIREVSDTETDTTTDND